MKPKNGESLRTYLNRRFAALEQERSSFVGHWRELSQFIDPRRGRFLATDRNRGEKKHQSIVNTKGTIALRKAEAGMLSGVMSPARPWFALATTDRDLMERQDVKVWLRFAEAKMQAIFNKSNLYEMAPVTLRELLQFGTGAMAHFDDFEDVARFYNYPVGSFSVAKDRRGKINVLAREYEMTVWQIVEEFGLENCSRHVKDAYDNGRYQQWVPVRHLIEPNPEADETKRLSRFKKFRSIYYEPGQHGEVPEDKLLSRAGFDEFPVHVPRWGITGEDVYGTDCPGMLALGDIKQLQLMEKRLAQALDKMVNPPLHGPPSLKNVQVSSLPGGLTTYDSDGTHTLKPLLQINFPFQEFEITKEKVERRIDVAFYVDLFQAITEMEGIQPRNELDLQKREQERLVQLGPVLQRTHGDFLGPLIDRTFLQCLRARLFPPPPEALQGAALTVDYISTLALAQRSISAGSIERTASFVGSLLQMGFEDAIYKFDASQAVDEYAAVIGSPPRMINPDEVAAERKQAVMQMQQQAQAMEMAQQSANAAKMASDAKLDGDSVLSRMAG